MNVTMTREEFERDPLAAEKAAERGPVFVTANGTEGYVLMSVTEYWRLRAPRMTLVEAVAMEGREDIEFEPPRLFQSVPQLPDLD